MCLAILAGEYLPIQFMGEYIEINFVEGHLAARETYDIIFSVTGPKRDIKLYCLSPHNLLQSGAVSVASEYTPGAGSQDDINFYIEKLGSKCSYKANGGQFGVTVPVVESKGASLTKTFSGVVLTPTPRLPQRVVNNGPALDFMETHGTMFELTLPSVGEGELYAVRLVVSPIKLLHLPSRKPVVPELPGVPVSKWVQHANVIDPKRCRYDFEALLAKAANDTEIASCAASLKTVIETDAVYTLPVDHHRIAILVPSNCEIDLENPRGFCIAQDTEIVDVGGDSRQMFVEWISGRATHPNDDPEASTKAIWNWLNSFSHDSPKNHEEIATAAKVDHTNVGVLVRALADRGMIRQRPEHSGRYMSNAIAPADQEASIRSIGSDLVVIKNFKWRGYDCRYSLTYGYLSPADRKIYERQLRSQAESFRNSRIAIVLAILGIAISILSWFFR